MKPSRYIPLLISLSILMAGVIHAVEEATSEVRIESGQGAITIRAGSASGEKTGLPVYPGSLLLKEGANVSIDRIESKTKVFIIKYVSDDAPPKLVDFYKQDMARFGEVLVCRAGREISRSAKTQPAQKHGSGLQCDPNDEADSVVVKAGRESSVHAVVVKPSGSGSAFTLTYTQNDLRI